MNYLLPGMQIILEEYPFQQFVKYQTDQSLKTTILDLTLKKSVIKNLKSVFSEAPPASPIQFPASS